MLINEIPEVAAHRVPDAMAIGFKDHRVSYTQLRDHCWQLSNALLQLAQTGDRIAVLAENCPEYVYCYYGVPGAGMTLTLLNYRLTPPELDYILKNSAPTVLIVQDMYLPKILEIRAQNPGIREIFVIGDTPEGFASFDQLLARGTAKKPQVEIAATDIAWLLYTSGTTGFPKGAMISHANLVSSVLNSIASWEPSIPLTGRTVFMLTFPMFHIAGWAVVIQHLRGVDLVILANFDPPVWFGTVARHRVTETSAAPTMLAMLLNHPSRFDYDVSSLGQFSYGAAAMPAPLLARAQEQWPGLRFLTGFGMTELSGNVMYLSPSDHVDALARERPFLSSVGRQMLMTQVKVVHDDGREAAMGEEGELLVKADQVFCGYWRNPEATRDSFTDGWFHTGDIARWDAEGYLYIVDRKKDMILSGGENIYPREVEEILYRHPAVLEAAVIGAPHDVWGEEVIAVINSRMTPPPDVVELIDFCKVHIASYKKPQGVIFMAELPKNASGKVLKRELRVAISEGALTIMRPM